MDRTSLIFALFVFTLSSGLVMAALQLRRLRLERRERESES